MCAGCFPTAFDLGRRPRSLGFFPESDSADGVANSEDDSIQYEVNPRRNRMKKSFCNLYRVV